MERTPEQQRGDRRAGLGCSAGVLVLAVAALWGGISLLGDGGTRVQARVLSCDPGYFRTGGPKCRGMWRIDGEFVQGAVTGAKPSEIGDRIEVLTRPGRDSAEVARGRSGAAIVALVLAAALGAGGVAMGVSVWRRRPPHGA